MNKKVTLSIKDIALLKLQPEIYKEKIEISKTHFSLKNIKSQIDPLIKGITDNEKEYSLLMEHIPSFFRDYWNSNNENILIVNNENKTYTASSNSEEYVNIPLEARKDKSIMLTIHNHPSGLTYQSDSDINDMGNLMEKFMITVGRDGITITKNNKGEPFDKNVGMKTINKWTDNLLREFEKSDGVKELDEHILEMSDEEYMDKYNNLQYKWLSENDNYNKQINILNVMFNDNGLPLETYHIGIERD